LQKRLHLDIPANAKECVLGSKKSPLHLTNLQKIFWPNEGIAKRDLVLYYASIAKFLLPHLRNRAMVMKRYPNGITGQFFFMKRTPENRPEWIETCTIPHRSGNIIDFPMAQNVRSLLWLINLGCIDLNQWYATCDDVDRPDYLHFDLDPVPPAAFRQVCETALLVNEYFRKRKIVTYPKTTGSRGIHIYIPIVRGPLQKEVWRVAKAVAQKLASENPNLITDAYRIAKRPAGRVLVDYNQNAWGRTLASVYSVRPRPGAPVSMPLKWKEIEGQVRIEDFNLRNAKKRIDKLGDLFRPLLMKRGRYELEALL
jgi:bifunctional non-homologous end joining protein LigD